MASRDSKIHITLPKVNKQHDQLEGEGGDSLIKVGTDVRARALGISGVNFCPGIRFWEENFPGY